MVLGIDVGGTKVCIGLVSEDGRVADSLRYPQRYCDIDEWADELESNIDCLLERNRTDGGSGCCGRRISAVGIGSRGHIDFKNQKLISATIMNVTPGFDLCGRLRERYGYPVYIDNDVKAVACAEIVFGAGRECRNFICYNVGTGIAAAVVADGRLIRGENNDAGEICSDMIQRNDGGLLHCGLEGAASGKGIGQEADRLMKSGAKTVLNGRTEPVTAREVFEACRRGDMLAEAVTDNAIHMLAVSIINMQHLLDPEQFILVGGVISDSWFFERLEKRVRELALEAGTKWDARLQVSGFGTGNAGLLGAASVAFYNMNQQSGN